MHSHMDKYVVFGNPIAQSKSPYIHTLFARQTAQAMTYTAQLAPVDGFKAAADDFFASGGRGCNITAPFKEDAYQYASQLTERAKLAGAVNTLKKLDDGVILGDNTDGEGLVQDLLQNQVELAGKRILLIGAGGAARGVILPILAQQPELLVVTNRTLAKAEQLAELFSGYGNIDAVALEALEEPNFDVIINSTSAGLSGQLPGISDKLIKPAVTCYDMVYGPKLTAFNQWARDLGAGKTLDGLGMLVGQAAESFMLWRGIRPGAKQVKNELRRAMQE
ncbi:shikimate dehydrogenase [Photobacterium proteolyticum]|uniref:Shikimate dehydrogenase (NADP(+)) n=1 Tax=Photobacterium proteolyticum TaxID=1903952 RepID=A0A1Q9H0W9_9GAMM|nr:shikimate dehydrogenase [Photobacterium proteolyticum]OLQ81267.1 shikimate dehydrogenase [Photobacterium proteolyticum]